MRKRTICGKGAGFPFFIKKKKSLSSLHKLSRKWEWEGLIVTMLFE